MKRSDLVKEISKKKSLLCVGLDTDIRRIPQFLKDNYDDPVVEFNRCIIQATTDSAVAYKFNIAFYEAMGAKGWDSLEQSLALVPPGIMTIADAKRGDIGNTSNLYARTFFETYDFDAITVAPYMGKDSIEPFYGYSDKWVIILGLTSNAGSQDFQMQQLSDGRYVFEEVIRRSAEFGSSENSMFVVGATQTEYLKRIRQIIPDHFLLLPGIGKQGGDLASSMENGLNDDYGLLINSSRGIIYADGSETFDVTAGRVANSLQTDMAPFIH